MFQYPITKNEQARFILFEFIFDGFGIFLLIYILPILNNLLVLIETSGNLNAVPYKFEFFLNPMISAIALLSLFISLSPSFFIGDFKLWLKKVSIPFLKHMIILYVLYNVLSNNYTLIYGSESIYFGKGLIFAIALFGLVVSTVQSYVDICKQL